MKVTVLGCGTSSGVPRIDGKWGKADPNNPKNRRRRVSVLVEEGDTTVIIDTSPDLREQCLSAGVKHLNGVLYTHDHADHTHGIDDLRGFRHGMGQLVDVYGNADTLSVLKHRFDYIFEEKQGYPPLCRPHEIADNAVFTVGEMQVRSFPQIHGPITSLGYRIGDMAYSTDLNDLPEESVKALEGVKVWIVDALRYDPHPTHLHLDKTLEWIDRIKPERAILTHMTSEMDYETLLRDLPAGVEPGYDGLTVRL